MFGMLTQVEEGKLHLEDEDAHIELIMNEAVGIFDSIDTELNIHAICIYRDMITGYLQMVRSY